jgi:hypothetical protein
VPKVPESILFILLSRYLIKECMASHIPDRSYLLKIAKYATPITRLRSHSFRITYLSYIEKLRCLRHVICG